MYVAIYNEAKEDHSGSLALHNKRWQLHRILRFSLRRYLLLFVSLMLVVNSTQAQRHNQDAALFAYNVGFGALTAGVGAVINKHKGEPWGRTFLRGASQGCLGGALQYAGKKLTYQIVKQQSYWYGWPAKLVHAAGASIVDNAAYNRPFGQSWSLDIGPARLDLNLNNAQPFNVRFNVATIADVVQASQKGSFNFKQSLQTGFMIYTSNGTFMMQGIKSSGYSFSRSLIYDSKPTKDNTSEFMHQTVAHEMVHLMQYREYLVFNTWVSPLALKLPQKWQEPFRRYLYVELPYETFFYTIEGSHSLDRYYRNFFEFEAERFSTNRYVIIH